MGLLYAWATPEYLLWHMTIGQVIMLHNRGIELKYPKPGGQHDYSDYAAARDDLHEKFPELRAQYGDIDGDTR